MSNKIKLTQEQADALARLVDDKEKILRYHMTSLWDEKGVFSTLNELSFDDMVVALYAGYEIEEKVEYRIDDWVVYTKRNDCQERVGNITHIGLREFTVQESANNFFTGRIKGLLRHATPEEIKAEQECRVWAGIGREVGEFKDGDYGDHISGDICTYVAEDLKDWYEDGKLIGFFPAESFISFGGESHGN